MRSRLPGRIPGDHRRGASRPTKRSTCGPAPSMAGTASHIHIPQCVAYSEREVPTARDWTLDRSPACPGSSWATASLVWYARRRGRSAAGLHREGAGCTAALCDAGAHPGLAETASPSALATASGTVVRTVGRRCFDSPALVGASTWVAVRIDIRMCFHSVWRASLVHSLLWSNTQPTSRGTASDVHAF